RSVEQPAFERGEGLRWQGLRAASRPRRWLSRGCRPGAASGAHGGGYRGVEAAEANLGVVEARAGHARTAKIAGEQSSSFEGGALQVGVAQTGPAVTGDGCIEPRYQRNLRLSPGTSAR